MGTRRSNAGARQVPETPCWVLRHASWSDLGRLSLWPFRTPATSAPEGGGLALRLRRQECLQRTHPDRGPDGVLVLVQPPARAHEAETLVSWAEKHLEQIPVVVSGC